MHASLQSKEASDMVAVPCVGEDIPCMDTPIAKRSSRKARKAAPKKCMADEPKEDDGRENAASDGETAVKSIRLRGRKVAGQSSDESAPEAEPEEEEGAANAEEAAEEEGAAVEAERPASAAAAPAADADADGAHHRLLCTHVCSAFRSIHLPSEDMTLPACMSSKFNRTLGGCIADIWAHDFCRLNALHLSPRTNAV